MIPSVSSVGLDGTLRRNEWLESALQESEERFFALANALPQIVWMARPDGTVDFYNERWYDYTGFERGNVGDVSWEPILHPDDLERCLEKWYGAVRTGRAYEIEYRFHDRKTGKFRWFLGRALPTRDDRGQIVRWFGTCTDIHEQKCAIEERVKLLQIEHEARAHVESMNTAKDRFLAVLSHELRTPLMPILLIANDMETDDALPESARENASIIRRNMKAITRLMDDLLDLTRVSSGKVRLTLEEADCHILIRQALEMLPANLPGRRHDIQLDFRAGQPKVQGDLVRLQQVFWNLILNAGKFTPDGGRIQITTENPSPTALAIKVKDNGMGIDPAFLDRIFDPFQQAENTTVSGGGLGLGLSISHALVRLHGGVLEARSQGHGHGAEFSITLPVKTPQTYEHSRHEF